jgi:hypothetical protein
MKDKRPSLQIRLKEWESLPLRLRQELLLHLPQVWIIWKPYVSWFPWFGRWVRNNLDLK